MKSKLILGSARTRGARGADGKLPTRMKVLDWGENPNVNGPPVIVNERLAQIFAMDANIFKEVDLDFEHNTVPGTAAYKAAREPRPIAGRCGVDIVPGDGVYINVIRYTTEGETNADHYSELSPTPVVDPATNEALLLTSVALCRHGASENTKIFEQAADAVLPMSAELEAAIEAISKSTADEPDNTKTPNTMTRAEMLAALGLAADDAITDEALKTKLTEALKSVKDLEAKVAKLETSAKGEPAPAATPMSAEDAKKITDRLAALEASGETARKEALIASAKAQGKVVPLSAADLVSLSEAQIKAICERTPKTVPLTPKTPENVDDSGDAGAQSEMSKKIAENCGVKPTEKK